MLQNSDDEIKKKTKKKRKAIPCYGWEDSMLSRCQFFPT